VGVMSDTPENERDEEIVAAFAARRPSEDEYLRKVESLAKAVQHAAFEERGASVWRVEEAETPLQRTITELCLNLRSMHYEGDGCLDDDEDEE
jgi:hypothetical protein